MRGVEGTRSTSDPNAGYKLLLCLLPIVPIALFFCIFLDPGRYMFTHPAVFRLLQRIQAWDTTTYLRPVALHPWFSLLILLAAAYSLPAYAWTRQRYRSSHHAHTALVLVPAGTAFAVAIVFIWLYRSGHIGGRGGARYYASLVALCVAGGALVSLWSYITMIHQAHTIRDITRNPSIFDLQDLEGTAAVADLPAALLLQLPDATWPDPTHSALAGRLCLGRLHERGKPTPFWVCPSIARLKDSLVVAPPGSGKTYSIALPWSLDLPLADQSVFAVDVKGNMYQKLEHPYSATGKPLYYFDPLNHAASLHWNPFDELHPTEFTDFRNGRDRLAEAIFGEITPSQNQFFDLRDLRWIKAGIELIAYSHYLLGSQAAEALAANPRLTARDLGVLPGTLNGLHQLFLERALLEAACGALRQAILEPRPNSPPLGHDATNLALAALADLRLLYDLEELKTHSFSELIQGVRNKLEPFGHPALSAITNDSTFHLDAIAQHPGLFVCSAPLSLGLMGSSMASIIVRMVQHIMSRRFSQENRGNNRLFLILDEFSKLRMGAHQTDDFISTSREAGCASVVFLQDISQIREDIRNSILANCRDKYFLRGTGPATAAWCSKALGNRRVPKASMGDSSTTGTKSRSAGLSSSISEDYAPVLREREIQAVGGLRYGAWVVLDDYSPKPILINLDRTGANRPAPSWWQRLWSAPAN